MTHYLVYIMFRSGKEGYFQNVEDRSIHFETDEPTIHSSSFVKSNYYLAPTYERALSKAKWLCKEFHSIVGRTEIIKWRD